MPLTTVRLHFQNPALRLARQRASPKRVGWPPTPKESYSFWPSCPILLVLRCKIMKVLWQHSLISLQVFSFNKTQEENGHSAISFVTIDSDGKERLPPRFFFVPERQSPVLFSWPRFVICWSQLQGSWDNVGPFHIYGSSGEPWLSVRLWVWEERGSVDLWGYFLSDRYSDPFFLTNINSGWSCWEFIKWDGLIQIHYHQNNAKNWNLKATLAMSLSLAKCEKNGVRKRFDSTLHELTTKLCE